MLLCVCFRLFCFVWCVRVSVEFCCVLLRLLFPPCLMNLINFSVINLKIIAWEFGLH